MLIAGVTSLGAVAAHWSKLAFPLTKGRCPYSLCEQDTTHEARYAPLCVGRACVLMAECMFTRTAGSETENEMHEA